MDLIRRRLVWLVVARAAILGALVLLTLLLGRTSPYVWPVSLLAVIVSGFSIVYAVALRVAVPPRILIPIQLGNDVLIVTWLVYRTGDLESPFLALYLIVIFAASLLSSRIGVFAITIFTIVMGSAVGAAILSGVVARADGTYYSDEALPVLQLSFAYTIVATIAVAVLSTHLADRQRRSDTELARTVRSLADLRAFNERVIESMRSGLITAGLDGVIASTNKAAEEITGRAKNELVGRPLSELFGELPMTVLATHPDDHRIPVLRSEVAFDRQDGAEVHVGYNVTPLTSEDGDERGVVLIFQDLTEIFELEREVRRREKLAALGTMAAGLAHEIRNPLASMRGSVQVLASELPLDEGQARLMNIIQRESDRLNRTVTEFLAYARPAPFRPMAFDLRQSLVEAVTLLRNSPEVGPLHAIAERYPDHETPFFGDASQIRQIFWNLARNGLKAMPDGGTLTVRLDDVSPETYRLSIEDVGIGMDKTQVARLFEPFSASEPGGTGLGMAIVYHLVNEHGGRISVDSSKGRGTRVDVFLPKRRGARDLEIAESRSPAAAPSSN
ncbi:MAG: PAS domain S-box protein [Blastocatellia bacterium]|nr:PAS domain S-box protein [Blastocatellia bacterium]